MYIHIYTEYRSRYENDTKLTLKYLYKIDRTCIEVHFIRRYCVSDVSLLSNYLARIPPVNIFQVSIQ